MYEYDTTIRYSAVDENGRIRLSALLNYLQDASVSQCCELGMTTEYFRRQQRAWFISYWDILIDRLPVETQRIICGTTPRQSRGLFAFRQFWISDAATRTPLVKADSVWFIYDFVTKRPVRIRPDDLEPFGVLEDITGYTADTHKVHTGDLSEYSLIASVPVRREMIDTNHHVNNTRYLTEALEALTDFGAAEPDWFPGRIRAEYKYAAAMGDIFEIRLRTEHTPEKRFLIAMTSPDGRDFCHIEFT